MSINDIPLQSLKEILASDTPLAIETTEALIARLEQAEQAVARVREAHKPKRITEYNVPVFDEFDSPTVTHNGCTCGSHYYPCPTLRALDGEQA